MKEAVGESAMTLITIVLVASAIGAVCIIIGNLLTNQRNRANCENYGYNYYDNACHDSNGRVIKIN